MAHLLTRALFTLLLLAPLVPCSAGLQLADLPRIAGDHPGKSGVYLLEKGEQSLLARAWLVEQARRSIDVQYFIWSTDNIGTLSSEALLRAAERGIKVRIIVDDLLIDAEAETLLSLAAHPNVRIRIYNPMHSVGVSFWQRAWGLVSDFRASNQRMHDKSVIYDGTAAITGGRNMADEYYDHDQEYNFRDRDVLLGGPVVQRMQQSFEQFWDHPLSVPLERLLADKQLNLSVQQIDAYRVWLHGYAKDPANFAPEVRDALARMASDAPAMIAAMRWTDVRFISDQPGKNPGHEGLGGGGNTTRSLVELIAGARQSITIQSPYLVMPEGGLTLFSDLIRRGVQVRIVTNSLASTDNLQAYSGYAKQREALLAAGLEIYEFKPDAPIARELMTRPVPPTREPPLFAIHAKSLVVDDRIAYIGTFNLDPRSANLNTEVGVVIHDAGIARQLRQAIERDMQPENSWRAGVDEPDSGGGMKRVKLWLWELLPLEPLL
ncbi:phospholipase D-like domain-containing protein [Sedimenticola hydrogenitrophicus]|uniref:phospholipase D-like domain-containing protein n=1 Tax=Sedimenticola hydrogenitrophicus TaxID=2967975 RepID=UPI0023AE8524|nr:phospholipase D family protein [Sedimenticola hydrogenitrophicus]